MSYITPETEMLRELRHAHQIIQNALTIMTPAQKLAWAEKNAQDGCDDDGAGTRAEKRKEAIQRGAACLRVTGEIRLGSHSELFG